MAKVRAGNKIPKKRINDIAKDKDVKINADGSVTLKLIEPIFSKALDSEIVEITIKKLTAKHLYGFKMHEPGIEDFIKVASSASGILQSDLDKMCPKDTYKVIGVVADFL